MMGLEVLLILTLGLVPAVISLRMMQQAEARAQARLRAAIAVVASRRSRRIGLTSDHQYIEGVGYLMGDITCQFNARSAYVRCAVNPIGPCQECPHYQPKEIN